MEARLKLQQLYSGQEGLTEFGLGLRTVFCVPSYNTGRRDSLLEVFDWLVPCLLFHLMASDLSSSLWLMDSTEGHNIHSSPSPPGIF